MAERRIIVGITGASGAPYAARLLKMLAESGIETHVAISALGRRVIVEELGLERADAAALVGRELAHHVHLHNERDVGASIASGSFQHDGMIIVPCSSNTLATIAAGITGNLVHRAAAVTLKERRRLVLAHRESPLSHIDIKNMDRVTTAGAIVMPLSPGFYLRPKSIDDLVEMLVGRMLDLLSVPHDLDVRWGTPRVESPPPTARCPDEP